MAPGIKGIATSGKHETLMLNEHKLQYHLTRYLKGGIGLVLSEYLGGGSFVADE